VTENGDLCYNISYPKAKKGTEAVVKPRKGPPTYGNFFHFLDRLILIFGVLTPLSTIFQLYHGEQF
jgi:hypothetical protein